MLARVGAITPTAFAFSLGFTAASYLALTGYDALALRHMGRTLPLKRVMLTSFIVTTVGHNLGVAMLSGGAIRLLMYTAAGLSALEVAGVVAMVGFTFGIGVTFAAALMLAIAPVKASLLLDVAPSMARGIGLSILALLASTLLHRVNAAYQLALALLIGGIFASLLKGLDWAQGSGLGGGGG